jgi:glucosamine--fructose-6-phosphate aminotransferase (isomerizing)
MCGIVGYVGRAAAAPILLDGLRRLEYRGYDSAGIATLNGNGLETRKCVGRIDNLADLIVRESPGGTIGISHTRWATHGGVTDFNAHPHADASGRLSLVHNGVIENYVQLKEGLEREGHVFHSQTDTEVLAHLIGKLYTANNGTDPRNRLINAVREALGKIVGTYGIGVIHADSPNVLVGARRGSPLVLGVGKGQNFLASDVSAMIAHTRDAVYLNDYDLAILDCDSFEIQSVNPSGGSLSHSVSRVDMTAEDVSKGDYPHFMLKEIFEQPNSVLDAMRGRLQPEEATAKLGGLEMTNKDLREIERIIFTACGTALHAAMVGEYIVEGLGHLPVDVEFASEFRYRNMPTASDTLVFAVSQSGETADTLAALRESQRKGLRSLGICNTVGSTIARESDGGVYMHAGPEIGVAATKSFTSQVTIMALIGLLFGRIRHLSHSQGLSILRAFDELPDKIRAVLKLNDEIRTIAKKYASSKGFLFFGRQHNYPVALEGALKLKEISYLYAQGHPSAELKHGVIALVSPETPSVFIAPSDAVFEKNLNNIEEVRARHGRVIAIGNEGSTALERVADDVIYVPATLDFLSPILTVIPLQLLAYHIAVELGCDVDKPRNLAKSVTVE